MKVLGLYYYLRFSLEQNYFRTNGQLLLAAERNII